MGNLKKLFDNIDDSEYCKFIYNGRYATKRENAIVELKSKELLEIRRFYPSVEGVIIAYINKTETRVLYFGEDAKSMKKTLNALSLPNSWPSNLGEKVFYLFRAHLEKITSGPISLEQQVASEKIYGFKQVIKRLINFYKTSE